MVETEKTRKVTKYVPLVTFQIKGEHHICDVLDEIEDSFSRGVKYGYHETYISKKDGAIVFTLGSPKACLQLFMYLELLKREKIKVFRVFPFKDLLAEKEAVKSFEGLIEELFNKLVEEFGEESIKELFKKSSSSDKKSDEDLDKDSLEELIKNSDEDSIKELYKNLKNEIKKLKIEN